MKRQRAPWDRTLGSALAIGVLTCAACERHEAYGLSREATVTVQTAVDRLAAAECARAERCEHLGPNGAFKSTGECLVETKGSRERDLTGAPCEGGVLAGPLDDCVHLTEAEGCDDLGGMVKRMTGCRARQLCASR